MLENVEQAPVSDSPGFFHGLGGVSLDEICKVKMHDVCSTSSGCFI